MIARIVTIGFGTLAATLAVCASAADEDVLSNSLRLGAYYITYDTQADDLRGPYVPPGVNIKLKDTTTLYFAYVRRLTEHFSTELALGAPPLTKTVGKGPAKLGSVPYNDQEIVTARWFAPTLLLTYSFFDESATLRPYIGAGINYTRFYSRQATPAGEAVVGGPTSISLTTSVGPAATIGLSYRLTRHFSLYGSLSASEVDSDFTSNTAGVLRKTHVSFGPRAAVLAAGYSF
jgi:outer membrane protein W